MKFSNKNTATSYYSTFGLLLALSSLLSFTSNAQNFSNISVMGVEPLTSSSAEWVDFNNDGLLDLIITGTNDLGGFENEIFFNNGDDTFNQLSIGSLTGAAYDLNDFNQDGFVDVLISGRNSLGARFTNLLVNNNGTSFTLTNLGLTGLSNGSILWEDLDNDGDLDILLTGLNISNDPTTLLYEFNEGVFSVVAHNLPNISEGETVVFDLNNDGFKEVLLTGFLTDGSTESVIFSINNNLETTFISNSISRSTFNSISYADYNEDGFGDLVVAGSFGASLENGAQLFQNNQVNGFTQVSNFLQGVFAPSVNFGDLNNDGLNDIVLTGIDNNGVQYFNYYANSSPLNSFTLNATGIPPLFNGDVALGDYDNDGDQDIFQIGNSTTDPISNLFESDQSDILANTAPSIPSNLNSTVVGDSVFLSWDKATDDLTNQSSLTYNIYISNEPNTIDLVISPLSITNSTNNGKRLVNRIGNTGFNDSKALAGLPSGRYYWSVQTIDNGHIGSTFAAEQTFAICAPFTIGADTAICLNENILLNAGEAGDIVNWISQTDGLLLSNSLTFNYQVLKTDTIIAELTRPINCTVTDTIIIEALPLPDFTLGRDTAICFSENIVLSVDNTQVPNIDSVNWFSTQFGELLLDNQVFDYSVTQLDTIVAEVFNTNGCINYDSIIIDQIPLPDFTLGNDTLVCFNEIITLTVDNTLVPNIDSVNWFSTQFGELLLDNQVFDYSVTQLDTIVAEVFNTSGCVNYDSIIIDQIPLPDFTLGNDTLVCFNEIITLTVDNTQVPNIDSVNWFSTQFGELLLDNQVFDYSVTQLDTIVAEVFNTSGCVNYDSIIIDQIPLPDFTLGNDTLVCFSEIITLTVDNTQVPNIDSVNWFSTQFGELLLDNQVFDYTVTQLDTLVAEVFNTSGCVNYDSIIINQIPLPDFTLGNDTLVCFNEIITLTVDNTQVPNIDSVNWFSTQFGELLLDNQVFDYTVTQLDTLVAEVFNTSGCVNYDSIIINQIPLPNFTLGNDTLVCFNEIITLTVDNIQVPNIDSVNWFSTQFGELLLDNQVFDYTVTQLDTLVAEVFNTSGCVNYDSIIINQIPLPNFTLGNDTLVCFNEVITLTVDDTQVPNIDSVNWFSTQFGELLLDNQVFDYTVTQLDTLVAEVFNTSGCVNYDSIIIDQLPLPEFFIGNDTLICFNESITLVVDDSQVPNIDSVNWFSTQFGELLLDNQVFDYTVTQLDTLVAEVFNTNGCVNYDTIIINQIPLPDFTLGRDTAICFNENIVLDVTNLQVPNIDSVNWFSTQFGELLLDNQTFDYQVTQLDTIVAEVFNIAGCVNYDTIIIDQIALPVFNLGNDTAICFNENILLLTSLEFDSVNWFSKGNNVPLLANSFFFDYRVLRTDTIIAEVFNTSGCVNYDTIAIQRNDLPVFSLGDDRGVCFADTARLSLPETFDEINWFTFGNQLLQADSSAFGYLVEEDLTLYAQVFDQNRCVNFDTVTISSLELPVFDLGEDLTLCFDDPITINSNLNGPSYTWVNQLGDVINTESIFESIAVSSDSIFVQAIDGNNCVFNDSLAVRVNPLPVFEIDGNPQVCAADSIRLSIEFEQLRSISWSNSIEELQTGGLAYQQLATNTEEYFAEITDNNGCINIDSLEVQVNPLPIPNIVRDTLLCFGEELAIGGSYPNESLLNFNWSPATSLSANNIANPIASPEVPTTYFLTLTDNNNCQNIDSIYVEVNAEIIVNAGDPETEICIGSEIEIGGDPTATGSRFPITYQWSPTRDINNANIPNPTVTPTTNTLYKVMVSSGRCIIEEDSILVIVNNLPEIEVSPQQSIGSGGSVELSASGGVTYSWTPVESLDDPLISTPSASPLITTNYTVEVVDVNGCLSIGEVNVLVQNKLFIPSLFTPNGDGNNDSFLVYGSGIMELTLVVFDTQGNELFRSTEVDQILTEGWDGTSNGNQLKNESYLWTISGRYFDGSQVTYNGNTSGIIKLIR